MGYAWGPERTESFWDSRAKQGRAVESGGRWELGPIAGCAGRGADGRETAERKSGQAVVQKVGLTWASGWGPVGMGEGDSRAISEAGTS